MLGIILGVLKILGILLLVFILMVLFLGICVLFYPISYCLDGEIKEEAKARISIRWLLGLVRFRGDYRGDTGFIYGIYVLFFKIYPPKEKKRKKIKKIKKEKKGKERKEEREKRKISSNRRVQNSEIHNGENPSHEKESHQGTWQKREVIQSQPESEEGGTFGKIRGVWEKVRRKIQHLIEKIQYIWKKLKSALGNIQGFIEFLKSKEFQDVLRFLNEQKRYLVKHIAPKKCEIEAKFGTGDPATTGEILAALSVVRTFFSGHWRIYPDFENVLFEGKGRIKGRFPLYVIILVVYRCYQNDMIKEIYSKFDGI